MANQLTPPKRTPLNVSLIQFSDRDQERPHLICFSLMHISVGHAFLNERCMHLVNLRPAVSGHQKTIPAGQIFLLVKPF